LRYLSNLELCSKDKENSNKLGYKQFNLPSDDLRE